MEEEKKCMGWNEYIIFAKVIDLFAAYRKLKGSKSANTDIAQFCNFIQYKLIDIYGESEEENGGT